jgi:hypothetical protein
MKELIKILISLTGGFFIGWIGFHLHVPLLLIWAVAFLFGFYLGAILDLFKKKKQ